MSREIIRQKNFKKLLTSAPQYAILCKVFCFTGEIMFEKNLQLAELIDTYAMLLSDRQQRMLDLYYNQDLSLGEIAEDAGISRQGVRDSIKKAERELAFFEEKLHLVARENAVREAGERLLSLLPDRGDAAVAAHALLAVACGEGNTTD